MIRFIAMCATTFAGTSAVSQIDFDGMILRLEPAAGQVDNSRLDDGNKAADGVRR